MVSRPRDHAGEQVGQRLLVRRPRLVTTNAFCRQKVRVSALHARHSVFVVHINDHLVLGALADRVMQPRGPLLRTVLNEAKLYPRDAPVLVNRQQLVELTLKMSAIDVEDHADAVLLGVLQNFLQVEAAAGNRTRIGVFPVLRPIPTGVKLDVFQPVLDGKIHAVDAALSRERHLTNHLAGLDPARVGDLRRRIEVEHQIIIL